MDGLYLVIRSFADLDLGHGLAVARAFDAHPYLRPVRVGGDPARLKVGDSMQALVAERGFPLDWLTVRRNGRWPDYEGGDIDLSHGRGAWSGSHVDSCEPHELGGPNHIDPWVYHLHGHKIEQHWLAATMAEEGAVEEAAALFEELVTAVDAAYGYVVAEARRPNGLLSLIDHQLPGVYWLNYFGPAFRHTHPDLGRTPGARTLESGGVLVRTAPLPWIDTDDGSGREALRRVFDPEAFRFVRPHNPALPSVEAHLAASPGTMEMPWTSFLAQKAARGKESKHAAARKRLDARVGERPAPQVPADAIEWSTSFDLDDFLAFFAHLKRRLGGELARPLGTAVRSVIATAPLDDEDEVVLETRLGPVRVRWFIDDTDTVDLYLFGSEDVHAVCEAWFSQE
ncbi:hypothetical protein IEQ44_13600 [Nocardioides sp. Y6]|uniref:Uncharacterized protein n=1 Tax=Nocardioides malaquae TaxID=2773426 RepID=A0ABR9RWZ5_9ACTN|nr:hypothetical protein [Nocardioides malaquae]MBE7325682.1 hypothetical protein [Nocardioides malaquae]